MTSPAAPVSKKRPHIGFRLEKDLVARVDAITAALAAAQPLLPAPDRSTVLRSIVASGIVEFEKKLGIPRPPSPAKAAPKLKG